MNRVQGFVCNVCGSPATDMFLANFQLVLPGRWMTWRRSEQDHPIRILVGAGSLAHVVCGVCAPEHLECEGRFISDHIRFLASTRRRLGLPEDLPAMAFQSEHYPNGKIAKPLDELIASPDTFVFIPESLVEEVVEGKGAGATWTVLAFGFFQKGANPGGSPLPRLNWEWHFGTGQPNSSVVSGAWIFPSVVVRNDTTGYFRRFDQTLDGTTKELSEGNFESLTRTQWNRLRDDGDALLEKFHRGPGHPSGAEYPGSELLAYLQTRAASGTKTPSMQEAAAALCWTRQTVYRRSRDLGGWKACWNQAKQAATNS